MKKSILSIILVISAASWQCSKMEMKPDLKQSLQNNVEKINSAISNISGSKGYELLSVSDDNTKGDGLFNMTDTITLDMVAGVYDYQPDARRPHHFFFPVSLFKKTGESDHMIVNMPQKMMFRPMYLFNYCSCDPVLENNFTIDATKYHRYMGGWNSFDYNLAAGFTNDSDDIGECEITSKADPEEGLSSSSEFTFPDGYSVIVERTAGDSLVSSFALLEDDDLLLGERVIFTSSETRKFERQYILSIGNIEIKRSTGIDSIQVFLDGVLQQKAAVKIKDESTGENTICHSRDLEITFDDGTTTNLSTLIDPAKEVLQNLVKSLGDMYFARRVVDYIALNISMESD